MNKRDKHIVVFEHDILCTDRGKNSLSQEQLKTLQFFYGEKGVPYYSLIHNGVKFKEYVGVIQLGDTLIEVLPKADKSNDKTEWRNILISMLYTVGIFNIHAPTYSNLCLHPNSILDLYFEIFVVEVEYLLRRGLIKKYRKIEGNRTNLKGSIKFAKHISNNLIHKERFYVRYTAYDKRHDIHAIIYKCLKLLSIINNNVKLNSRLAALLLDFPHSYDINVTESNFGKIVYNRKTEPYRNAIEIAKLILLNYHPNIKSGNSNVLALMFDMNVLWEKFVYVSLKKHKSTTTSVTFQNTKNFWKPECGCNSKLRPDIVLNKGTENCVVLDTKWKNLNICNPSSGDLRQMFAYMQYYGAKNVALIYPGAETLNRSGRFYDYAVSNDVSSKRCCVITIGVEKNVKIWQKTIYDNISMLIEL